MHDLLADFARALPADVREIEEAFGAKENTTLESKARSLKSTAGSYGFESIKEAARELERAVQREDDRSEQAELMQELISLCMQVRSPKVDDPNS